MKTWLAGLALFAAMTPVARATPVEPPALVAGTVFETGTHRAVVNAKVRLVFAPGIPPAETTTDDKGRFSIETTAAPTYVVVQSMGFETYTVTVAGAPPSVVGDLRIALNKRLVPISSHHWYSQGPCAAFHPSQTWDSYVLSPGRCGIPVF